MFSLKNIFKPTKTHDVFTPTIQASLTFVERQTADKDLIKAINTPGYQVILYGYSGCGKSTLIFKRLNELGKKYIISRCEEGSTLENILLSAFDSLNPYYIDEKNNKLSGKVSGEVKTTYKLIEGKIASEIGAEEGYKYKRILPPQLTPQKLAQFFGAANCSWIIEDFHKVPEIEKKRLSQIMKIFMDNASENSEYLNTKVYAIGAVGTARQVLNYDRELTNRVAEINVPLMNEAELKSIIIKGEKILNVKFGETITKRIINLSNGLASICHHLCLNICINNGINKARIFTHNFKENDLDIAVEKYVLEQSDTFKSIYDDAVNVQRKRTFENGKLILSAMIKLGKEELSHNEILIEIRKSEPLYPSGNLTTYLKSLTSPERDEIIRFDDVSSKVSFKNPFFKVYSVMQFEKEERIKAEMKHEKTNTNNSIDIIGGNKNVVHQGNSTITISESNKGNNINIGDK